MPDRLPEAYHRLRITRNPAAGFTLLEIIVAFFIFAIIVTTLFGSYRSVFSEVDRMDEVNSLYETARNCLERMAEDLQSLHLTLPPVYRPPDMNDPPDPYRFKCETVTAGGGEFPRLRFTSLAHLPLENSSAGGIAEITYYVQPDENELFVLRRADKLYPYRSFAENSRDPILCRNLKSLAFVFFDAEGREFENWDSDAKDFDLATPRAVAIRLVVGDHRETLALETAVELPVVRNKSGKTP